MLREVEYSFDVVVNQTHVDANKQVSKNLILDRLFKQLLHTKSTEQHGYVLAVTKLESLGTGKFVDSSRYVKFPVCVHCRTFLPVRGEIMCGVVYKVYTHGVFLMTGPMKFIYLSGRKMPGYSYMHNDGKQFFVNNDQSRIELDVVLRFEVFATRWTLKSFSVERDFQILASLDGDCLGPLALNGQDGLEL